MELLNLDEVEDKYDIACLRKDRKLGRTGQFHFVTRDEQKLMKMSCAESKELSVTDTLMPVCISVYGSSGGLAGAQRACVKARLWVLLIGLTLKWPAACITRMPSYLKIHTASVTANCWPS